MYAFVSILVSLAVAFAFESYASFIATFIITFIAAFFILAFITTIVRGENHLFNFGLGAMTGMSESAPCTWMFYGLPGVIFVFVGIVGGFVTAPIWYTLSSSDNKSKVRVIIDTSVTLGVLYAVGIALLIVPALVYQYIHFGWIIGVFISEAIITLLTVIVKRYNRKMDDLPAFMLGGVSILLIPLMMVGVISSAHRTYSISTPDDMKVFGNAPVSDDTVYLLENNISFKDVDDLSWFGAQRNFKGFFDGQGYTLSDIKVKADTRGMKEFDDIEGIDIFGLGFVRANSGIIKGINFKNCEVSVTSYNGGHHMYFGMIAGFNRGKIYDCNITNCKAKCLADSSTTYHTSLTVGMNSGSQYCVAENITVTGVVDSADSFYKEDDMLWSVISGSHTKTGPLREIQLNLSSTEGLKKGDTVQLTFTPTPTAPSFSHDYKEYKPSCIEYYVVIDGKDVRLNNMNFDGRVYAIYSFDAAGEYTFWAKYCNHEQHSGVGGDIVSEYVTVNVASISDGIGGAAGGVNQ